MRRSIFLLLMFVPMIVLAQNVDISSLPSKAQNTLKTHLKSLQAISVDKDLSIGGTEYEVDFACGGEAEFNSVGELMKIKCPKGVPQALIPAKIKSYLTKNYKGVMVYSMDNDRNDVEIELGNGIELKFATNGQFLRIGH